MIITKIYRWFVLIMLLCISTLVGAQHKLSGIVKAGGSDETLIGATIEEKGTTNGTITDIDGKYEISLSSANATIIVKYVGYTDVEVAVGGRSVIDVNLEESSIMIDQVVVVGYGVQKKSDLTGAVSSLKGKELERVTTPNIEQALQGKIPGVYVAPASGQPGAGATIRIRGTGTLNNNNPLYVIDGMITEDASSVNPQDVESIEVLNQPRC